MAGRQTLTSRRSARRPAIAARDAKLSGPSDELRIAVTFRRPQDNLGLTEYLTGMTSDVIRSFSPDPRIVGRALELFQRHGFTVTKYGRLAVSVRGSRADFERLFGTHLTAFHLKDDEYTRYASETFFFPPDDAPWNPADPELTALIDDAYIQWPHIYLNNRYTVSTPSPIPPRIDYHHLRVPGDVALVLNAAKVHRQGTTGMGVRVAMIDSGFAHGHPYFTEMGYNSSVVLAPGATHVHLDGNGHGTGESANIFAIAPDVTFIGVKLDSEDDPNVGATVLEGFQEALTHNPQVISVSLGYDLCPHNPFTGERTSNIHLPQLPNSLAGLEAEIAAAVASGIVVVFSAGNGHVSFPGMMPDVISAGGVFVAEDGEMSASDYASAFTSKIYPGRGVPDCCGLVGLATNHADYVMLPQQPDCAIDRDNAVHDGTATDDGWGVFSGTSAAAPQLAGVCALLLQKNPGLTPADVSSVLRRTSRDVINGFSNAASNENAGAISAGPGADNATGDGLVDAFAAWQQV